MKLLIASLVTLFIIGNLNAKIISIETRSGTEQLFDLIKPENNLEPTASIILFVGGGGYLEMDKQEWKNKGNFLARTRTLFRDNNFAVAVVDAPSEFRVKEGMPAKFRTSSEHVSDIDEVIKFMKKRFKKPVWLIGTSRGTLSASYIGINSKEKIDGVVLTSSVSKANKEGTLRPITELNLENLSVPTLVVHHEDDGCYVSPAIGARKIYEQLGASKKEIKLFSGGKEKDKPCKGISHHGFFKIEKEVVDYISDFIKENSK